MSVLTGTSQVFGVSSGGGIREDLEDVIWDLFPEDTWCVSNLDKVDATSTTHEWLAQTLLAAASNKQLEGADGAFTSLTPPGRFGNYTQILSKTFLVSDTLEAVKKAGRGSEVARGAMVKMRELKRDMEYAIIRNTAASAGTAGSSGRAMAGMETWIGGFLNNAAVGTTNTASTAVVPTVNTSASTPALTSGVPTTAPTDQSSGATAAFDITHLQYALQGAWSNGGDASIIITTASQKALLDGFASVATRFVDVDASTQSPIIGAANVFVSDFGRHTVILHRYMRTGVVLCLDPNYWAIAFLRRPMARELARTGDGTKYQIITECTLVARNNQASAKVVALS